jgi:hypothetical protein
MAEKTKKIPLSKWVDIYPQGTKTGDEEQKFFICLARHPTFVWRSVAAIAFEIRLPEDRVEQIIAKYFKKKMIYQNPKVEDQWGYWERIITKHPELIPDLPMSVSGNDKKNRIDDAKI